MREIVHVQAGESSDASVVGGVGRSEEGGGGGKRRRLC